MSSEFEKYAVKHCGISSLRLHDFRSVISDYVSPTIIEERQLNVATMDVFSRLMMDRIIFLGALGIASMWTAIFADVGVMIIAVLNATRALYIKDLAKKNEA